MSRYGLASAPRARRQIHVIDDWWRQHRPAAPDLFASELETALQRLCRVPAIGTHPIGERPSTRKLLLPRCRYHIYYDIDEPKLEVQVVAVWHKIEHRSIRIVSVAVLP